MNKLQHILFIKQLPIRHEISIVTYSISLYLLVTLETINTFQSLSVQALVNSRTTNIFINKKFVNKYYPNTYKLFQPVLVYNIDRTFNKTEQISKMVVIIPWYKMHVEQTLLVILNLGKQNLILGLIWLKFHNSKINWQKEELLMTCYSIYYSGY